MANEDPDLAEDVTDEESELRVRLARAYDFISSRNYNKAVVPLTLDDFILARVKEIEEGTFARDADGELTEVKKSELAQLDELLTSIQGATDGLLELAERADLSGEADV